MKIKIALLLVLVLVLVVAVTPAFAQGEQPPGSPVTLPTELEKVIEFGITMLVVLGLKSLSNLLGKDLTGWAAGIAAGITASVVFFFNAMLSLLPTAWQVPASYVLAILVAILGSMGLFKLVKSFAPNPQALSGKKSSSM